MTSQPGVWAGFGDRGMSASARDSGVGVLGIGRKSSVHKKKWGVVLSESENILSNLKNDYLRKLYLYWQDRRGDRAFPARKDLDPIDFRYIIGNILLIDVLQNPLRFRCRLHGTNLSERAGYDMTGKMVDELPGDENRTVLVDRLHWLMEWRKPFAISHTWRLDDHDHRYEVIWLPLSDDGTTINMFASGILYEDSPVPRASKELSKAADVTAG